MNILTMLWKNLLGGNRTMLFPARPKASEGYRGLVKFDPELCTGCAICRFRCTARAIEFRAGKGDFVWSYDPGQCTFCGRCVEGCKSHALSQEEATPPIYLNIGELKKTYTVARKPPTPKPPAPDAVAAPVVGSQTSNPATGGVQ
ncbi:MAG TPA: 4Fe-4S binding protein [Terracidiphilus sp.]|nr:4Fe-4S binding protein [Terracidiphilus sp.]